MKVLQLIDSLEAGGSERMAVNFANALSTKIDVSFLCATRKEGLLKAVLNDNVGYLFINKKTSIDFKAIFKLNRFIKTHEITIVHAHSSSFFTATMVRFLNTKLKIFWHDHYGDSENLHKRTYNVLRFCSQYFVHILSVNKNLESWAKKCLKTKRVNYLPNFTVQDTLALEPKTKLQGKNDKRIINLANLRPQKDQLTLLKAFKRVLNVWPDWSLHLVGKDFKDHYSKGIHDYIKKNGLEPSIFMYGSCTDIPNILNQSTIGVLSSKSEGLPLALLEYGLAGLPTIATNVGDCMQVITTPEEGMLVPPKNPEALANALLDYISNDTKRQAVSKQLNNRVKTSFTESTVMDQLIKWYNQE